MCIEKHANGSFDAKQVFMIVAPGCAQDQQMEALVKSEKAAEAGDVDESMKFAEEAEAFGEEHATLEKTLTQVERTMAVCNTCGVFINSTDNDARKHEHLQGKQYLVRSSLMKLCTPVGSSVGQLQVFRKCLLVYLRNSAA